MIGHDSPRVSVVILNWNGVAHLPTCLDALVAQTLCEFEVVLVDNGSRDGSLELLRSDYPWVRVVALAANTGFATGNNRGFAKARGDYIVTLNNDTRVEPDWLDTLVKVADARPRAGMVASRVCSFSDPDVIDSIGMGICRDGMSRGRFRNRLWSGLAMREVEEILFPSACAALYKRAMIAETGFFDDDFFAYAEDVDLGLRGRLAGWEAVAATKAVVRHRYSQTCGSLSPFKLYLVERNHYWVGVKNLPLGTLLAVPFFTLVRYLEQARSVVASRGTGGEFLASGSRGAAIRAIGKGTIDAIAGLPRMLRKRRQIMRGRQISDSEMGRLLESYQLSFRELLDDPG
ncbi:MAG: glycosyltransferase family 2 protein [Deferrisomatales bacterium]|nr:glycosyltransferase family 2 protein [Deferrisomatales bacterium]